MYSCFSHFQYSAFTPKYLKRHSIPQAPDFQPPFQKKPLYYLHAQRHAHQQFPLPKTIRHIKFQSPSISHVSLYIHPSHLPPQTQGYTHTANSPLPIHLPGVPFVKFCQSPPKKPGACLCSAKLALRAAAASSRELRFWLWRLANFWAEEPDDCRQH